MMTDVTSFIGDYHFLSNFYKCNIIVDDMVYASVEHAYHSQKTLIEEERKPFLDRWLKPSDAKKLGKKITIRKDWDQIKVPIMQSLVEQKFNNSPRLRFLLSEIDGKIIEGNYWGDVFWGQCPLGNGQNHLGKILMRIRDKLKEEHDSCGAKV